MSTKNVWLICHNKEFDNKMLTAIIVSVLKQEDLTTKQVALDLGLPTERIRNWYYRNTGMTALDLLKVFYRYEFMRCVVLA